MRGSFEKGHVPLCVLGLKRNRDDGEINVRIAWEATAAESKKDQVVEEVSQTTRVEQRAPLPTDFPLSFIKNKDKCDSLLLEYFENQFGLKRLRK